MKYMISYWWLFYSEWMMLNMCALFRILLNPIWFRYLLLMEEHPSMLSGCSSTIVYVRKASDGQILLRFYLGSHMSALCTDSCNCIYDTSINEVVDIPCRNSPYFVAYTRTFWILESSFVVWLWDWVMTNCCCLLQQWPFSKLCHFDWDIFPAKYHGLCHSPPQP